MTGHHAAASGLRIQANGRPRGVHHDEALPWTYHQSTGALHDPRGRKVATGYSGHGVGKNNGAMQAVSAVGPIPVGLWAMVAVKNSSNTGPFSIILEPVGHNALGRTLFRVHGDSVKAPGTASHGCIIVNRAIRELMWSSKHRQIKVIA